MTETVSTSPLGAQFELREDLVEQLSAAELQAQTVQGLSWIELQGPSVEPRELLEAPS